MSLPIGNWLGPYEIVGRLGAGGMGEVYRARDSRLNREIALKILAEEFAKDAGRRARFEQEAHTAAALIHPNIVGLHDVGEQDGVMYIVSDLVAGETLGAIIAHGPMAIKKLLDIAAQIADGMSCAHAAGIVHRDLKPANIMITPEGRAKILDFGLARQTVKQAAVGNSEAPTVTEPGSVMGTVQYMSPEQARGQAVDHRSDQFSFGLILYEMAAGRRAFGAPEPLATMMAIVNEEAPPIERAIPAPLRWTIDRCLAKERADRYESSRDLYQELRNLRDHASEAVSQQAMAVAGPQRWRHWSLAAGSFCLGLLCMLMVWLLAAPEPVPDQSQYRITPFAFDPGGQSSPVWSPDGKAVAYSARGDPGSLQVFLRRLDSEVPVQVTHIAETATPAGWSADGSRILFQSSRQPQGLWSIAAVGGDPLPVLGLDSDSTSGPIAVAPDGKAVALSCRDERGFWGLCVSSPLGSPLKRYSPEPFATREIVDRAAMAFSPDGRSIMLLFDDFVSKSRRAWLLPYPPDPGTSPRQVLPDLPGYGSLVYLSWTPDSRHLVLSMRIRPGVPDQLWDADVISGKCHLILGRTGLARNPAVSPDGRRILFAELTIDFDVVSASLDGSAPKKLIATDRSEMMPDWAAKQAVLTYVTDRNGPEEIWVRSANIDRPVVTERDFPAGTTLRFMGPSLSPQGDRIVYKRLGRDNSRLWISAASGGSLIALTDERAMEYPGSWSPDAVWFAYTRESGAALDLMKVKTSGQASPEVLKAGVGEGIPSWSPSGEWIALGDELISPDGKSIRSLGRHGSRYYMFSADGRLVYGMRSEGSHNNLFSVDVASGLERIVGDLGAEFRPASPLTPGIRFSLAPDGKSFVYTIGRTSKNLWLLEGFGARSGIFRR